jgi:hypothetical protein
MIQQNRFEPAFASGTTLAIGDTEAVIELLTIGVLYLPTGHIVACDPLTLWQAEPFAQRVPPGHYPITLSLGQFTNERWHYAAFAKITFSNQPAISWKMAIRPGKDLSTLGGGEFFGYGVDSVLGQAMLFVW